MSNNNSASSGHGLQSYFPEELQPPAILDYEALAAEIGKPLSLYHLPTTPEGEAGPWVDRLELCQDAARHVRDGGEINVDRIVVNNDVENGGNHA